LNITDLAAKHAIDKIFLEQYNRYRRKRIACDQKIVKFVEALWRFIFYSIFVVVGYYTLFVPETVVWVRDVSQYWTGWPKQRLLF